MMVSYKTNKEASIAKALCTFLALYMGFEKDVMIAYETIGDCSGYCLFEPDSGGYCFIDIKADSSTLLSFFRTATEWLISQEVLSKGERNFLKSLLRRL